MRKKNLLFTALLALLLVLFGGCVPAWEAVFISLSDQPLHISVFQTGNQTPLREFTISPGQSRKSEIALGLVVVSDNSSKEMFRRPITLDDAQENYHRARKRELRLLVMDKGIFPIPFKYWGNWKEHLDEILLNSSATNTTTN